MELKSIATRLAVWCRNTVFWCCDRAELAGCCRNRARAKRATERTKARASAQRREHLARVIGQCCLVARCTVLCNCSNYSVLTLFMGNVKNLK